MTTYPIGGRIKVKYSVRLQWNSMMQLAVGLILTVMADYFILIKADNLFGVIIFCSVQLVYLFRLKKRRTLHVLVYVMISTFVLYMIFPAVSIQRNPLLMCSAFYFILICLNLIFALESALINRKKSSVIYAVGMLLFILCDLNVALFNAREFIPLGEGVIPLIHFSSIAMWFFYLPSQILIAISVYLEGLELYRLGIRKSV